MPDDEERRLESRYAAMTEEELRQLAADAASLSDDAQQALRHEVGRRNLDIPLVFPNREEVEFRELVTVQTFRDLPEAILARGILEAAGIECFLADDNLVRMDWFWSNAVGGIKLQVPSADAEAAHEVLQQPIPENFSVEGVGEYQQPRCPKCNSLDTVFEASDESTGDLGISVGVPIPIHDEGWACKSCGHHWDEFESDEPEQGTSS